MRIAYPQFLDLSTCTKSDFNERLCQYAPIEIILIIWDRKKWTILTFDLLKLRTFSNDLETFHHRFIDKTVLKVDHHQAMWSRYACTALIRFYFFKLKRECERIS